MKRLAAILTLATLVTGLTPLAWAQAPRPSVREAVPTAGESLSVPGAVIYFSDFEGNNGGFAGTLDWEWGTYSWTGAGCDPYQNYPPPGAYSGTDMWGTVLNGCYVNRGNNQGYSNCVNTVPGDDSILSITIDLTGVAAPVTLSWWEWYDLFSNWDWAEVYANGNVVFQHCEPNFVPPTAWVQRVVDLSPYAGGPVTIEFHMMASTVVNHAGWYIDDVMVTGESQLPIVWDKTIDGLPWVPDMQITRQTSDTIVVEEVLHLTPPPLAQGPVFTQTEAWNPAHLNLLGWAATGGNVIVAPDHLLWTGEIVVPETITLTKWFHVEPCTWTVALLQEELWLDGVQLEQRPVVIHKVPPDLWIASAYEPLVCPDTPAQFRLDYGNLGGYENMVLVRNEFPPEAPFAFSTPPPDNVDPAGLWAEWLVGDLPTGAEGHITVTVAISSGVVPGEPISIYDWIIDHVGEPRDMTEIVFQVGAPDIAVDPPALSAELCPEASAVLTFTLCNVGDCDLTWDLAEVPPTTWLSVDPAGGTVPPAECATVDVALDATGVAPGDYVASLSISSNDPDEPQVTLPVTMTVLEPVAGADFTWAPEQPVAGEEVHFTATVAAGSEPLAYAWDFGDGYMGSGANPVHAYDTAGTYTVLLTVTNACGQDYATYDIDVREGCVGPSGADFTWLPPNPGAGQAVTFTGSTLSGTLPITYTWAFGDGGTGVGNPIAHTYASSGTYTVMMTATNACGYATATYDVLVSSAGPMYSIYLPIIFKGFAP